MARSAPRRSLVGDRRGEAPITTTTRADGAFYPRFQQSPDVCNLAVASIRNPSTACWTSRRRADSTRQLSCRPCLSAPPRIARICMLAGVRPTVLTAKISPCRLPVNQLRLDEIQARRNPEVEATAAAKRAAASTPLNSHIGRQATFALRRRNGRTLLNCVSPMRLRLDRNPPHVHTRHDLAAAGLAHQVRPALECGYVGISFREVHSCLHRRNSRRHPEGAYRALRDHLCQRWLSR